MLKLILFGFSVGLGWAAWAGADIPEGSSSLLAVCVIGLLWAAWISGSRARNQATATATATATAVAESVSQSDATAAAQGGNVNLNVYIPTATDAALGWQHASTQHVPQVVRHRELTDHEIAELAPDHDYADAIAAHNDPDTYESLINGDYLHEQQEQ